MTDWMKKLMNDITELKAIIIELKGLKGTRQDLVASQIRKLVLWKKNREGIVGIPVYK